MANLRRKLEFEPTFQIENYNGFSDARHRGISLMAEMGLPLYKIHHSIVIADAALMIADEVQSQTAVKVNLETCEIGALLHDVGISQIVSDDMPEHTYIGAHIARAAGFSEEIARCIELHDSAGLVKEYCDLLQLPISCEGNDDLIPRTWEEKIVAYADQIISLEGEWKIDVWNDDMGPARAVYQYLAIPLKIRQGMILPFDHPQITRMIEFNKEMRRFAPRERYERELRQGIERMICTTEAAGIKVPFFSYKEWPPQKLIWN